jgi:hypothetical protein
LSFVWPSTFNEKARSSSTAGKKGLGGHWLARRFVTKSLARNAAISLKVEGTVGSRTKGPNT